MLMFLENDQVYRIPERSILDQASGAFARRVFILIREEAGHPDNLPFLNKILAAAQIHLEKDTLFIQVSPDEPLSLLPVLKEKHPDTVLVFGVPLQQVGIVAEIPFYQPYIFYGARFLLADSLSVLAPDKVRKGKLWQALQQMFLH